MHDKQELSSKKRNQVIVYCYISLNKITSDKPVQENAINGNTY